MLPQELVIVIHILQQGADTHLLAGQPVVREQVRQAVQFPNQVQVVLGMQYGQGV